MFSFVASSALTRFCLNVLRWLASLSREYTQLLACLDWRLG